MEKYNIEIKKTASKELAKLPAKELRFIIKKISDLANNPRPIGSKKLCNQQRYRIRHGNYRILYTIEDNILTVVIVKVGHRKCIYR